MREGGRLVEACGGCFPQHGLGGFFEGDEDPDGCLLSLDDALQVTDLAYRDVPALDLDDDGLCLTGLVVEEVDVPVDTSVRALPLVVGRAGIDKPHGPPFELVTVFLSQCPGPGYILWITDDFVWGELRPKGVVETVAHEGDGEVGDIDPDPAPIQTFGHDNGSPTAAKGVKNNVLLAAASLYDPLQEGLGLLRGVTEALLLRSIWDVVPYVLEREAFLLVEITLLPWYAIAPLWEVEPTFPLCLLHPLLGPAPYLHMPVKLVREIRPVGVWVQQRCWLKAAPSALFDVAVLLQDHVRNLGVEFSVWQEVWFVGPAPDILVGLRVEEDDVMNRAIAPTYVPVGSRPPPDDLVSEIPGPEDGVHHELEVVARRRVAVQIDASGWLQHTVQLH